MDQDQIKVIITGSTGMVGEGVLLECLENPKVESVLTINRKHLELAHPKLKEIILPDFFNVDQIQDQLKGYNACYFCAGISSVGISKSDYYKITYELTMHFAEVLSKVNPDLAFFYVSGAGTDSSEKGRSNWARVKGKTENDLMKLSFRQVYAYRPAFMKPVKGQQNVNKYFKYVAWLFPLGRKIYPAGFSTLTEVGKSMIYLSDHDYPNKIIGGKDIIKLAKEA